MKKCLLVILVLTAMVACKKSSNSVNVKIFGKWELTRRYGGNILPTDTTYQPGNGNIYQFNTDGSFKQYAAGAIVSSGTFSISGNQINFNTGSYNPQAFNETISISGNILSLRAGMADAATLQYDKISN